MLQSPCLTEYEILLDKTDFIYQSYGSNLNGVGSWLISSMNQTAVQQYGYTQTLKNFENTIEIPCFPQSMQSYAVQMGKEIIPLITEIDTKIRFHDRVIRVAVDDEQEGEEEREVGEGNGTEQEQHSEQAVSPDYYSSFGSFNSKAAAHAGRDPSEAPAAHRVRPRRRRQRTVYRTVTTMDIHEQKIIDDLIKGLLLVQARQTDAILRLTRFHILSSLNVCEDLLLVWKSKLVQKTQAFRLPIPRSVLKYIPGFGRRIRTNALQSLQQALNNMNIGSISRDFNFNFIKQFQIQLRNQQQQQQQQPVPIPTPRRPWWNPFHRSQAPSKTSTPAAVPVGKEQTPTETTREELPEDWPPTEQLNFRVVPAKRGVNRLVFEPLQNASSAIEGDVGDDLTNTTSANRDSAESDTNIDNTDEVSATDPLSPANRVINRLLKGLNTREKVLYLEVIQFELYDMAGKIQLQLDQLEPIGNQLTASCKEETLLFQQYNILDQAGRDMQPVKPSSDGPGVVDEPSSDDSPAVLSESVLVSFQRNHKWDTRRKRLLMALSDSTIPASGVNSVEPQGSVSDGSVTAPSYHSAWDDLDVWISRSSALCKESLSLVYLDRHYQSSPFLSRSPSSPVYPSPQAKSVDVSPSELTATKAGADGIKVSNDVSQPSTASASTAKPLARSKRDELLLDIAAEKEALAAAGPGPSPLRDAERAMEASFLKIDERYIQENQVRLGHYFYKLCTCVVCFLLYQNI